MFPIADDSKIPVTAHPIPSNAFFAPAFVEPIHSLYNLHVSSVHLLRTRSQIKNSLDLRLKFL
jgi:hypothetical protein